MLAQVVGISSIVAPHFPPVEMRKGDESGVFSPMIGGGRYSLPWLTVWVTSASGKQTPDTGEINNTSQATFLSSVSFSYTYCSLQDPHSLLCTNSMTAQLQLHCWNLCPLWSARNHETASGSKLSNPGGWALLYLKRYSSRIPASLIANSGWWSSCWTGHSLDSH